MALSFSTLQPVLDFFAFPAIEIHEILSGNVNRTYHVIAADGSACVAQRLNPVAFHDPTALMRNSLQVLAHMRAAMEKEGLSCERRLLEFLPGRDGTYIFREEAGEGGFWRMYRYIDHAIAYDRITDPRQFYEAGRGFGRFQHDLADLPADCLAETIPDFHNTPKRFARFLQAVEEDRAGRADRVREEIAFFEAHRELMGSVVPMLESGELPLRVNHNDTKLNNVLLDEATGEALCVIDLDTVMPGTVLYDFGDAIRSGASTAAEDEEDLSKVSLDLDLFRAFTKGFLRECGALLTPTERELLPLGCLVITLELAMRFLTDYLDGDRYFKVRYTDHNLIRARAQMALFADMEKKRERMAGIIRQESM